MRPTSYLYISLFSIFTLSAAFANDGVEGDITSPVKITQKISSNLQHLKTQIKVDASAAQEDNIKDPFQSINRSIYSFNDAIDRTVARPLAVQYTKKIPSDVRGSSRLFRKNLGEPWNAVNQLLQGRFTRSAQTFGRFTINTITTLGFADPAARLGLNTEEEDFGTTLGYYGIPSGPYLMLPLLGPSTFRDSFGRLFDSQARPQKYILEDSDGLYWGEQLLRGIDARAQVLDVDQVLQGDKYAELRDIYLQRKNFSIAEKKGLEQESLFMDDLDSDEIIEDDTSPLSETDNAL